MKFIKKIILLAIIGASFYYGGGFYFKITREKKNERVNQLFNENKWPDLIKELKGVKPKAPLLEFFRKPDSFIYQKAYALEMTSKHDEALKFWEYILTLKPEETEYISAAKLYCGINFYNEGAVESASTLLNESLDLDKEPHSLLAAFYLTKIYYDNKELDEASAFAASIIKKKGVGIVPDSLKDLAGEINLKRITSRKITRNSVDYVIKPGDTLGSIAMKHKTTVDLIKLTNNMTNSVIRPNNHLKVINASFSIIVNKTTNNLLVLENGDFFKEYKVGTGKDNVTPVGDFMITSKQKNPTWYKHDGKVIPFGTKENLLGTRWMAINYPGYGIHGTWDDDSVGKQSSAGCIRLRNADVEELYSFIPEKTPLTITE